MYRQSILLVTHSGLSIESTHASSYTQGYRQIHCRPYLRSLSHAHAHLTQFHKSLPTQVQGRSPKPTMIPRRSPVLHSQPTYTLSRHAVHACGKTGSPSPDPRSPPVAEPPRPLLHPPPAHAGSAGPGPPRALTARRGSPRRRS
jgi:hypothetical protein